MNFRFSVSNNAAARLLLAAGIMAALTSPVAAATLVGDAFITGHPGWVDAFPPPARAGNWRLSLHNPTLMDTNNANPPTSGGGTNTGLYEPDVLVQDNFTAPSTYDVNARMRTNDDDIIGLVWNYLDPQNYFRVGIRTQAAGTFGGTQGLAVQKIVGGVVTQISPAGTGVGAATPITQAMINNRTPFDLKVAVDGPNYQVSFNGTPIVSGSDADLVAGRKVGIQSWAQLSDTDETPDPPSWGTEVESISVTQGANTLYNESFADRPVRWRNLLMTNAAGINGLSDGTNRGLLGNFGLDIDDPWIYQQTNGFLNATAGAPNVDFIGPAVVVDDPGSATFSDYEMKVRFGASDNDGIGVLVRVQDDNNFYRVTFHSDPADISTTRPPLGLSVQKVRNGVWTELFQDGSFPATKPEGDPLAPDAGLEMHDLSVRMVGNTMKIQVVDNFGVVHNYPLITDANDPLLTGTAGLHTWGNDDSYFMNYGGVSGPLLIVIPEPASALLLALGCILGFGRRMRNVIT